MEINKGPVSSSGIIDVKLSKEMIEFLENFNCVWLSNGDKYYKIPYWFKTTLSDKGLSSSYDNIFINKEKLLEYTGRYGVYNYTKKNYKVLRKWVSDHLPVFIEASNSLDLD